MNVDAIIEDLKTLVEVESPSRDVQALTASAKAVAGVIENRLGGQAVIVESEAGPHVHWSGGGDPQGPGPRAPRHGVPARHPRAPALPGRR